MKSAPDTSSRNNSLTTVIIIELVGIGLLVFLTMSGVHGLNDMRTGSVHGQSIAAEPAVRLTYQENPDETDAMKMMRKLPALGELVCIGTGRPRSCREGMIRRFI
jgi:hypothetical protein